MEYYVQKTSQALHALATKREGGSDPTLAISFFLCFFLRVVATHSFYSVGAGYIFYVEWREATNEDPPQVA